MALFNDPDEQRLMEDFNAEMYTMYFPKIEVFKTTSSGTYDNFYHEDVNRTIPAISTYSVEGYMNITDNGLANLYKGGIQVDRQLIAYFSRALLEEVLRFKKLDIYADIPTDGDNILVQNIMFKIITVDPEGYHSNTRTLPYDYAVLVKPEAKRSLTVDPRVRDE